MSPPQDLIKGSLFSTVTSCSNVTYRNSKEISIFEYLDYDKDVSFT